MSIELALGNYLTFNFNGNALYRFQNFHIAEPATFNGETYQFLPFIFSGVSISRTGDNIDASVAFPNNELSRAWAVAAIENKWTASVYVMVLNPDDRTMGTKMYEYHGQVAEGNWDETTLKIVLNTVLDAVGADVPMRRLTQKLVGAIPMSSNVRLQ
jgi:hypothetical protein